MCGIENYGLFVISGIMLNITPGADTVYILSRSVSQGRKAGIISVCGITAGGLTHTTLAALGLSVILGQSAFLFNTVRIAGAAYLIFLGLKALIQKGSASEPEIPSANDIKPSVIFRQGYLTSILNPKTALFFLSYLPQFVNPRHAQGEISFLILGCTFAATGTAWCLFLAYAASAMTRTLRRNRSAASLLRKMSGAVFAGLGLKLLLGDR